MSTKFRGSDLFKVYCGDTTFYFKHGRPYRWGYLNQIFKERLRQCPSCGRSYELFPGLVLQDDQGNLWTVQLQAVLTPTKPEDTDETRDSGEHSE